MRVFNAALALDPLFAPALLATRALRFQLPRLAELTPHHHVVKAIKEGTLQMLEAALAYFNTAAPVALTGTRSTNGYADAMHALFLNFFVTERNDDAVVLWERAVTRTASRRPNPWACNSFSVCLSNGDANIAVDEHRGMSLIDEAIEQGHVGAMFNKACKLKKGLGVPTPDHALAQAFYDRAYEAGLRRARFQASLTVKERVARAQALAHEEEEQQNGAVKAPALSASDSAYT
eukprot:TRINITY_DN1784_c0_g1_i1.p3 TRINITY_DN1784_c0_g1~~TRINITY_DN1784_c0_g1_i1.p3  ORF type:complete len:234 (-),score=88.85 TRINITY_DN1784_c0_g1_i1:831-1532(-)